MKNLALRFSILLALGLCATAHAQQSTRYVILVDNGKKAGEQTVETRPDGKTKVHFIFKDNGRGPELAEEYTLRPDGTYADYKVKGTTTFGAPVEESFQNDGSTARWKSTSESGEKAVAGSALYIPLGGTPQNASLAVALLAKSKDRTLPLYPSGTLKSKVLQEVTVESDGVPRTVQLLANTGLGLNPQLMWATKGDIAKNEDARMFAFIIPGFLTAIEEGWEGNEKKLLDAQQAAEGQMVKDLAARQFKKLDGLAVVKNTRVWDSKTGKLGAPSDVYVLRGRITAIVPAGTPDSGAQHVIDAGNRVMIPGLFDMHGHEFGRWNGGLHLAAGVTTVRDMGNDNATLQALIDETERGEILEPQIVPAGFLEGESNFSARNGFVIKNLDEAKKAIDWYDQHGYPQLKIYNSFPKDILKDTVAYAHSRGMRVSGHIPAFLKAQDAVDAGFDEIQHINQLMLNFLVKPDTDTRTLERFRLPAEYVATLDFDSAPVQAFIKSLKDNDVAVDPTLATFDYIRQRPGEISKAYEAVFEHVPLDLQRQFKVAEMNIPDDATAARYTKSYEKMVEFVGRLHKAGITVLPGTDAIPGFTLHRELELYVQAGMTPVQALQSATSVSAKMARVDADRGSIEVGKRADLVLLEGDPTQDISAVRNPALVLTQGRIVSPADVYDELGIKPFAAAIPVRDVAPAVK
jgi:hypothetical protein